MSKKEEISFADEFKWLWKAMTIEKKYDTQQISDETRAYMHKNNDNEHNNKINESRNNT